MTGVLFIRETIYSNIFRCIYVRNEKYFLKYFRHYGNLDSVLNIFKKNVTLIDDVFLTLRTPRIVVREMSKKSRFKGRFDKEHGKHAETLFKVGPHHLYIIY